MENDFPPLSQVYRHKAYNPHFPHCYFATCIDSDPVIGIASRVPILIYVPHSPQPTPPADVSNAMVLHGRKWKLRQISGLAGEARGVVRDGGIEGRAAVDQVLERLLRGGQKKKGNWKL